MAASHVLNLEGDEVGLKDLSMPDCSHHFKLFLEESLRVKETAGVDLKSWTATTLLLLIRWWKFVLSHTRGRTRQYLGRRSMSDCFGMGGWCNGCHEQIIHDGIHKFPQQIMRIPATPISHYAKPETKPPTQTTLTPLISLQWVSSLNCLQLRVRRNRRSGNSHDLFREFVNSIMNNMFMTFLPIFLHPSTT